MKFCWKRLQNWTGSRVSRTANTLLVLTWIITDVSIKDMTNAKRITANLPRELLAEAMKVTKKGITETLVEGLRQVRRQSAYEAAMALRGKIKLDVDLEESRERRRR